MSATDGSLYGRRGARITSFDPSAATTSFAVLSRCETFASGALSLHSFKRRNTSIFVVRSLAFLYLDLIQDESFTLLLLSFDPCLFVLQVVQLLMPNFAALGDAQGYYRPAASVRRSSSK